MEKISTSTREKRHLNAHNDMSRHPLKMDKRQRLASAEEASTFKAITLGRSKKRIKSTRNGLWFVSYVKQEKKRDDLIRWSMT